MLVGIDPIFLLLRRTRGTVLFRFDWERPEEWSGVDQPTHHHHKQQQPPHRATPSRPSPACSAHAAGASPGRASFTFASPFPPGYGNSPWAPMRGRWRWGWRWVAGCVCVLWEMGREEVEQRCWRTQSTSVSRNPKQNKKTNIHVYTVPRAARPAVCGHLRWGGRSGGRGREFGLGGGDCGALGGGGAFARR